MKNYDNWAQWRYSKQIMYKMEYSKTVALKTTINVYNRCKLLGLAKIFFQGRWKIVQAKRGLLKVFALFLFWPINLLTFWHLTWYLLKLCRHFNLAIFTFECEINISKNYNNAKLSLQLKTAVLVVFQGCA